jgi:hypothetical protein
MAQAIVPAASGGEGSRFLFHPRPCPPCFQRTIRCHGINGCSKCAFPVGGIARTAAVGSVRCRGKVHGHFDKPLAPTRGLIMIPAANVIRAGAMIVPTNPDPAGFHALEVLKIMQPFRATSERR